MVGATLGQATDALTVPPAVAVSWVTAPCVLVGGDSGAGFSGAVALGAGCGGAVRNLSLAGLLAASAAGLASETTANAPAQSSGQVTDRRTRR